MWVKDEKRMWTKTSQEEKTCLINQLKPPILISVMTMDKGQCLYKNECLFWTNFISCVYFHASSSEVLQRCSGTSTSCARRRNLLVENLCQILRWLENPLISGCSFPLLLQAVVSAVIFHVLNKYKISPFHVVKWNICGMTRQTWMKLVCVNHTEYSQVKWKKKRSFYSYLWSFACPMLRLLTF